VNVDCVDIFNDTTVGEEPLDSIPERRVLKTKVCHVFIAYYQAIITPLSVQYFFSGRTVLKPKLAAVWETPSKM
jgi:hypothetical protein